MLLSICAVIAYIVLWVIFAWRLNLLYALWPLGIALLLSIFSTVADEAAEKGKELRMTVLWVRGCVNAQWALAAFYAFVLTGTPFAKVGQQVPVVLLLFVLSLLFGLLGLFLVEKRRWAGPALAGLSFAGPLVSAFLVR